MVAYTTASSRPRRSRTRARPAVEAEQGAGGQRMSALATEIEARERCFGGSRGGADRSHRPGRDGRGNGPRKRNGCNRAPGTRGRRDRSEHRAVKGRQPLTGSELTRPGAQNEEQVS